MNRQDAIYARQSVEKKDSLSISGQVDLCRRMAGEKEPAVYRDAGYSGKNTERPGLPAADAGREGRADSNALCI